MNAASERPRSWPAIPRVGAATCVIIGAAMAWWQVYRNLEPASKWFTYRLLGLPRPSHLGSSRVYQTAVASNVDEGPLTWRARGQLGIEALKYIVGKVWPYVLLGIAVGAGIHGYVPQNFMASIMGKGAWWSVPVAVLLGIPMYSNAAGIIPVVQALLGKGAALGTVLAFMMSVIGLSLPEMIILRKVLKLPLIATFAAIVGLGIVVVGQLFNAIL